MEMETWIIIVWAIVHLIFAVNMGSVSEEKGYDSSSLHPAALVFFFGLFGCIYIAALPDLKVRANQEKIFKLLESSSSSN